MASKRQRMERAAAKAEAEAQAVPQFDTEQDANAALSDTARVLNIKAGQEKAEKAKASKAKVNKDGRPKLPPLPRAAGKPKPLKPCECGCPMTTRSRFAPGHDSRLRGWCLRVERGVVKLADVPDGEREMVVKELKARKKAEKAEAVAE